MKFHPLQIKLLFCTVLLFVGFNVSRAYINDPTGDYIQRDSIIVNGHNDYFLVVSKQDMEVSVYDSQSNKVASYPMACGKNYGNKQKAGDMKTPEGVYKVQNIHDASAWTHDFHDGKGNIKGAYGPYFIRLYTPPHTGIGIHGTHDDTSIGTRVTEGCIRLRNKDVKELVEKYVYRNMPVIITPSEQDVRTNDGLR